MKKTNVSSTSRKAYKEAKPMIPAHHAKILGALSQLGTCNYEKIATHVGMDKHQVGRRLSELEALQMVYKPGTQTLTSTGRNANDYCLTGQGMPKTEKEVHYKSTEKTAAEYASDLINNTLKPAYVQPNLFNELESYSDSDFGDCSFLGWGIRMNIYSL